MQRRTEEDRVLAACRKAGELTTAAAAVESGPTPWYIGNNGGGKLKWFVLRGRDGFRGVQDYHRSVNGDIIRYTHGGALRTALALNAKGA